jgi:DNA-binding NarL/FixJ family response regulator
MAGLAQAQGHSERAVKLAAAAAGQRAKLGASASSPPRRLKLQQALDAARQALGARASAAWTEGETMSLEEAVLYARGTAVEASTSGTSSAPAQRSVGSGTSAADRELAWLTAREREVLELLLKGHSNRQIAEDLVVTERTAETHVCRILNKLNVRSRAQIPAWAISHGLLKEPRTA